MKAKIVARDYLKIEEVSEEEYQEVRLRYAHRVRSSYYPVTEIEISSNSLD